MFKNAIRVIPLKEAFVEDHKPNSV